MLHTLTVALPSAGAEEPATARQQPVRTRPDTPAVPNPDGASKPASPSRSSPPGTSMPDAGHLAVESGTSTAPSQATAASPPETTRSSNPTAEADIPVGSNHQVDRRERSSRRCHVFPPSTAPRGGSPRPPARTATPGPQNESARRNAYAQRTGSPTPDDAAPARRPVCAWRPRRDPTRARDRGPSHRSPHKPATCAHSGLNDPARRGRSSAIASLMRERSTRRRGFPCAGGQEKQPPAGGNGQATRRTLPRSPWRASLHPAQTVRTQP